MEVPSSSDSRAGTTVQFDVGGTIYKVSRSLIEQHPDTMLARLASDTWSGSENKIVDDDEDGNANALFIERDGERFRYCLDFMRDGGAVALPVTIPKDAFLQDLAYYGFDSVDPSKISETGTLPVFRTCLGHIDSLLSELEREFNDLEWKKQSLRLVTHCLRKYRENGSLRISTPVGKDWPFRDLFNHLQQPGHPNHLKEGLERVGFEWKGWTDYSRIYLGLL
mmetsp:Transcript_30105/g.64530  ORF Transcript_30105/g.64530 Transcript_30105/m.64530 type:complete len:223 (-) Transcript_30105:599-1267(-)